MTQKQFFKKVTNDKKDLLQEFISILIRRKIPFCIIGGLAVNAYAEPVVSLDLDVVIVAERINDLVIELSKRYRVKKYPNTINISSNFSDLRIQLQIDPRYQDFIRRTKYKDVVGYKLPVADIKDVMQSKIWAAMDETRRLSKRQKDLADILRLVEVKKNLASLIPETLRKRLSL